MVSAIRDSSLDYRTYWLQGGQYYERRGLGAAEACVLPADKLAEIPEADRKVLLDEVNADPLFCKRVALCMATYPDWGHRIAASAKEAVVNEMDPTRFKNRAGMWPKLRETVRTLVENVTKMVAQGKFPVAAKRTAGLSGLSGLGQWDIIGSIVGAVAQVGVAAAGVYQAGVTQRSVVDQQRDQANAAIAAAQAQMNAINAAGAMQTANASINPISALTSATVAGIPVLALAIPAIGLIIYFATKK